MTSMKPRHRSGLTWPDEGFERVFRDMFRDFFSRGLAVDRFFESGPNLLHVEEYVEDGTCVIRAELPGIDAAKDIEIEVRDGMLHVRAHREERKEEERPSGYHSEFRYGSFARTIRLPEGATESAVTASYRNGILEIRVPVPPVTEKAPIQIPIEHD